MSKRESKNREKKFCVSQSANERLVSAYVFVSGALSRPKRDTWLITTINDVTRDVFGNQEVLVRPIVMKARMLIQ